MYELKSIRTSRNANVSKIATEIGMTEEKYLAFEDTPYEFTFGQAAVITKLLGLADVTEINWEKGIEEASKKRLAAIDD